MKLLYCASLVASGFAQSTYEDCTVAAQCNYSCDSRENCYGTGRTGIFQNQPDKACCGAGDVETICADLATCLELPANITLLNDGTACKLTVF